MTDDSAYSACGYTSVSGVCRTTKTIEKSEFITTSSHVESDGDAKAFVREVSSSYRDATHNCFAYIADKGAQLLRFSDDGEPSGTAGMPILDVIKSRGLVYTAVVVTRYFGGIKLGAGGLVRAYSGCCAENLSSARIVRYELHEKIAIECEYSYVSAVTRFTEERGVKNAVIEYGEKVRFVFFVRSDDAEKFVFDFMNTMNGVPILTRNLDTCFLPV